MSNEIISFGAGVNSVAMAILLISEGWRGHIAFADPGAEHPDTYCYLEYFERWLKPHDLRVERLSPQSHPELYHPSYRMSLLEKCRAKRIVPIMLNRWCTAEYKRVPLTRFAKREGIAIQLLGIASEEARRARIFERDGIEIQYPLVDRGIDREQCREIIRAAGLAVPPKSGCWICPFQTLADWRELYDLRPDLFQQAVDLDSAAMEKMREHRANPFEGQLTMKHGRPLATIKQMWDLQLELPLMPEKSYDWQMCECKL